MAWEYRNGKRYYYLSQRENGRVRKLYFGSGPEAELAAATVEANRLNRKENRDKLNVAKAGLKLAGRQMEQLRRPMLYPIELGVRIFSKSLQRNNLPKSVVKKTPIGGLGFGRSENTIMANGPG